MSAPPRIGVAAVFEAARWSFWDEEAALVPSSYHRALMRAGALDLPLVPDPKVVADPDLVLDLVDGLLLIGGVDIHPSTYGGTIDDSIEATSPSRDEFEIALTLRAIERGIPFLGICRGMQIVNVALGGTLRPDLGETGNALHRPRLGTFDGTEHDVTIRPDSLASLATDEHHRIVHSHHHQAIDKLGDGLLVTAEADDGTPEAVELPDPDAFVLGVQWHPEADEQSKVVDVFTRAAARAAARVR